MKLLGALQNLMLYVLRSSYLDSQQGSQGIREGEITHFRRKIRGSLDSK